MIKPLSANATRIFGLISANVGSIKSVHIFSLIRLSGQPKAQIEAAIIELVAQDYVQYDTPNERVYITKARRKERSKA